MHPVKESLLSIKMTSIDDLFFESGSDLLALYQSQDGVSYELIHSKGHFPVNYATFESEWLDFVIDSNEIIIVNDNKNCSMNDFLLHDRMRSGIASCIFKDYETAWILVLNSINSLHYNRLSIEAVETLIQSLR